MMNVMISSWFNRGRSTVLGIGYMAANAIAIITKMYYSNSIPIFQGFGLEYVDVSYVLSISSPAPNPHLCTAS